MANVANILNTPVLLHGIGKGVLKTVQGKILEFTTAQSMKLNVTTSSEDVYGGDSLFPLYTYLTQKEGTVEITNADFKLSQVDIAQGTKTSTTGNKRNYMVKITKVSAKLTDDTVPVTGVEVIAMVGPDGKSVPVATDAGDDVVAISETGAITVGTNVTLDEGEYNVWFRADSSASVAAEMLKNAMPEVSEFTWMFTTEDADGNKYQIDIYARRVRANGELAIETARDSASTPTLTVKILDPGDGRDDFATITITKL